MGRLNNRVKDLPRDREILLMCRTGGRSSNATQFLAANGFENVTNVNGGAVAIGHPLAATGLRLLIDLMYEMERRGVRYGCASACIGGGQGAAIIIRDTEKT